MKKFLFVLSILCLVTVSQAAKVNTASPDFSLKSSENKKRSLADYKGKVLFINFWASWCGPCQIELPQLDQMAREYEKKNFAMVAINQDQDQSQAEHALDKLKIGYSRMEILWDPKSTAASTFNLDAMPSSFIVDPQGTIRYVHMGFHKGDPEKWRKEIDSLLKDQHS